MYTYGRETLADMKETYTYTRCMHTHTCMHERDVHKHMGQRDGHIKETHILHIHVGETHTQSHMHNRTSYTAQKVCAIAGFSSRLLSSN